MSVLHCAIYRLLKKYLSGQKQLLHVYLFPHAKLHATRSVPVDKDNKTKARIQYSCVTRYKRRYVIDS